MWKFSASAIAMATVLLTLAKPAIGNAQDGTGVWSRGGLGNMLFDRWIDNRREARGIPTSQLWYYDPDEYGLGNRLFDRWIDNRRAACGIGDSSYGFGSYSWPGSSCMNGCVPQVDSYSWSGSTSMYGCVPQPAADNMVRLRLTVPSDAKVWVENKEMMSTGALRVMESPPLVPGQVYTYHIRVQWRDQGGQEATLNRNVDVRNNDRLDLNLMHSVK